MAGWEHSSRAACHGLVMPCAGHVSSRPPGAVAHASVALLRQPGLLEASADSGKHLFSLKPLFPRVLAKGHALHPMALPLMLES